MTTGEWSRRIVVPGESYWSIAESVLQRRRELASNYYTSRVHTRIIDCNKHRSPVQDINRLPAGVELQIPPLSNYLLSPLHRRSASASVLTTTDLHDLLTKGRWEALQGATFEGDVAFPKGNLDADLCFCGTTFNGDVTMQDVLLRGFCCFRGASFNGQVNLRNVSVGDDLVLDEARASGDLILHGVRVAETLSLHRLTVANAVYVGADTEASTVAFGGLQGTSGGLYVSDTVLHHGLFAHAAKVAGRLHVENVKIAGDLAVTASAIDGDVRAVVAVPCGVVSLRGTTLGGAASLDFKYRQQADFASLTAKGQSAVQLRREGSGGRVTLDEAVLEGPARWRLEGTEVTARRLQVPRGGTLEIGAQSTDLTEAEFAGPTVLRAARAAASTSPGSTTVQPAGRVEDRLVLTSLQRANVTALALSQVDLSECRFAGTHGLDELRIEDDVVWAMVPQARWRFRTKRQVIAAERFWRSARGDKGWDCPRSVQHYPEFLLDAARVAALYRALRKGSEDRKNEPGAADFYYGEMEMRRLCAGTRTERLLLGLYWLVSGYGLRAWRALVSLLIVVLVATGIMATVGFADAPPPSAQIVSVGPSDVVKPYVFDKQGNLLLAPPPRSSTDSVRANLLPALAYSAESATVVFRGPEQRATTLVGRWCQIMLRLLGPVLLGLALLSIRGRLKR